MTKRVVLLAQPAAHSLIEALQEAAFVAVGIDAHYEPLETATVDLPAAVDALRGDEYLGASIGAPHRDRVVPLLDRLSEAAQGTGVVDTVAKNDGQLVGHNTDVIGFRPALEDLVGNQKMPRNAVVIGAGDVGRAAIYALIQTGFQNIALFNRHLHRGERLVKHFGRSASHMDLKARPWHDSVIEAELAKTDILINASSLGADPDETPIPAELLPPEIMVLDLHTVPAETRLLREAREAGATRVRNGDVMLIAQVAAAFEMWTGQQAPRDVLTERLAAARSSGELDGSAVQSGAGG
jgi:shikimate dehydrogenase